VTAQVDDFVADLSSSLAAFRTCGQLQYLLAFVRDVANTMNASAVQGAAVEGFKLESLARLQVWAHAGSCVFGTSSIGHSSFCVVFLGVGEVRAAVDVCLDEGGGLLTGRRLSTNQGSDLGRGRGVTLMGQRRGGMEGAGLGSRGGGQGWFAGAKRKV